MKKTCSKCKNELDTENFDKNKSSKDGYCSICKLCRAKYRKLTAKATAEYNKKYREEHKEYYTNYIKEHKEQYEKYRLEHKNEKAAYDKLYVSKAENKQQKQIYDKVYYRQNKNKIKQYAQNNKTKIQERNKQYRLNNIEKLRDKDKHYYSNVVKNNHQLLLNKSLSCAINSTLNIGVKSERHWEDLVDFTFDELTQHLESQFDSRMNWLNHGIHGWHIDHIIPKNSLPYNSPEDLNFKIIWSIYNLRPLWCTDNWNRPKDGRDINIEELKQFIIEDIKRKENKIC